MNAGIVILTDGTPCVVLDEALPHAVSHAVFDAETYQLSLVYDGADAGGKTFEYPVDPPFVEVLRERNALAIAYAVDGKLVDIAVFSIKFT